MLVSISYYNKPQNLSEDEFFWNVAYDWLHKFAILVFFQIIGNLGTFLCIIVFISPYLHISNSTDKVKLFARTNSSLNYANTAFNFNLKKSLKFFSVLYNIKLAFIIDKIAVSLQNLLQTFHSFFGKAIEKLPYLDLETTIVVL